MNSNTQNTANIPQQMTLREINFSFENLKQKIVGKLDAFREDAQKQVLCTSKTTSKNPVPLIFNADALKTFERIVSREMEELEVELTGGSRVFEPNIVSTVEVDANIGFNYGANIYNQKHNMIITCPSNSTVHFHDATELGQLKQRRKKRIDSSVVQMSYDPETDTYLMGCAFGDVYTYNATANILTKILKEGDSFVLGISHITRDVFAFSSSNTKQLYFGNVKSSRAVGHYSKNSDAWYIHHMKQEGLLFAGLANGQIAIYNTQKGPKYPMIESLQAHRIGKYVTSIINVNIKGKEYIITGGNDKTIKIWQFMKGKMRLLKVIQNSEDTSTIVYLEKYKMIATTHHKDYIKFFKIPSGELQTTLPLGLAKARNMFFMPDKNALGVADLTRNVIRIVQLHPSEKSGTMEMESPFCRQNFYINDVK